MYDDIMNRMIKNMMYILARIQLCWEHHQDGSDLLKSKRALLFRLIFNDLKDGMLIDFSRRSMLQEGEEEEIKQLMEKDYIFKQILEKAEEVSKATNNRYCKFEGDFCKVCKRPASFEVRRLYEGDVPCGVKCEQILDKLI